MFKSGVAMDNQLYQNKATMRGIMGSRDSRARRDSPTDRLQRPNRKLYHFWYVVGDRSPEVVKAQFEFMRRQTVYMIHYPYELGVKGVFQYARSTTRWSVEHEMGVVAKMLTKDEMERIIGEIHRNQQVFKETGIYNRDYKQRVKPEMDPDYFRKYWDEKNNEEAALKIRLKRERESWRPYVYDPDTGIVTRNQVEQPKYEIENHTSEVVEEIMSAYLPGQLLESDTEIDE